MKKIRNYTKFLNEIINLVIPFEIKIIGYVKYEDDIYPMIQLKHVSKAAKKNIIIMSGQHGSEFYTTHILIKWLKQFKTIEYEDFNIYIYPVINPSGYEYNIRKNIVNQETTNSEKFIKNSDIQELSILFDAIPSEIDLALDIHGDTDEYINKSKKTKAPGKKMVYAYERKLPQLESIAEKALIENDNILPYIKTKTIYASPVKHGVIDTPDHDVGIEDAMEQAGAEYTITVELPSKCDSQQRTAGGIAIINSILRIYKEQNKEPIKEPIKELSKEESIKFMQKELDDTKIEKK